MRLKGFSDRLCSADHNHDTTVIELFSTGLNTRRKHECVFHANFSWMLGPTGCPGSVPNSETETLPWPNCCHTAKTGNSKGQSLSSCRRSWAVCFTPGITSLTPTPRLREHMPPKYARLLLRNWKLTFLEDRRKTWASDDKHVKEKCSRSVRGTNSCR